MSQPISWYMPRTPAARPTAFLPSQSIVRTLWVAMMSSLLRARSWSLLACLLRAIPLCLCAPASWQLLYFCKFISHILVSFNSCPLSRLRFWPREEATVLLRLGTAHFEVQVERSLQLFSAPRRGVAPLTFISSNPLSMSDDAHGATRVV